MTEPINLNKARKAREKASAKKQAAENRVAFGRTNAQKTLTRAQSEKAERELDAKRRLHDDE
ncbi:MAG TPA: DUF4169 family protein [Caulobacteraceae bacterium]|jgi:hypothetical protein